ncbi:RNA polymerase sigma factor [Niabella aurantiaca]|uniref:RNA polymerase sigma factor n=1 Tax=Niabella aurantiaca TaxID=379900 RepID=UPI0003685409|nr:sigma-70 family RNA polymerase sigma factor [Niabella aurantiaca]
MDGARKYDFVKKLKSSDLEAFTSLWKLATGGNQKAYRLIVEEYFWQLFNYGLKYSRDEALLKDTVQDLFVYIWEKRATLATEVNIKAYLFSSFRRMLHRKLNPQIRMVDFKDATYLENKFDLSAYVDERLIKTEQARQLSLQVTALLNGLPLRQKEVVYLKFFHNMSRDEIASILNIAPQTVSNILQMALKNLRCNLPGDVRNIV